MISYSGRLEFDVKTIGKTLIIKKKQCQFYKFDALCASDSKVLVNRDIF